ncbi:MAG: hypothetical protein QM489_07215 [Candidatus Izemoplasma sp.]
MNRFFLILITVVLLSVLSGCSSEKYIYVDSGYKINEYTIYFREYKESKSCLNEEYYIIYPDNYTSEYVAVSSVKSLNNMCSSTYYIEYNLDDDDVFGYAGLGLEERDGHIVVYHAYALELFSMSEITEFTEQFTIYRINMIGMISME